MLENRNQQAEVERGLTTDIAIVATPVAALAAPVIGAWANQHFGQDEKPNPGPPPPPQQQPKD
jgi:hypothetical protein